MRPSAARAPHHYRDRCTCDSDIHPLARAHVSTILYVVIVSPRAPPHDGDGFLRPGRRFIFIFSPIPHSLSLSVHFVFVSWRFWVRPPHTQDIWQLQQRRQDNERTHASGPHALYFIIIILWHRTCTTDDDDGRAAPLTAVLWPYCIYNGIPTRGEHEPYRKKIKHQNETKYNNNK